MNNKKEISNNMDFTIIFEDDEKEKFFFEKIEKIKNKMIELVNEGCLLPEDVLGELNFICSNRNIAQFSEIALVEDIKYNINELIEILNLDEEQIKNLSKYIVNNIY